MFAAAPLRWRIVLIMGSKQQRSTEVVRPSTLPPLVSAIVGLMLIGRWVGEIAVSVHRDGWGVDASQGERAVRGRRSSSGGLPSSADDPVDDEESQSESTGAGGGATAAGAKFASTGTEDPRSEKPGGVSRRRAMRVSQSSLPSGTHLVVWGPALRRLLIPSAPRAPPLI